MSLDYGDAHRPQLHILTLGALDDSGPQQLGSGTGFLNHPLGEAVRRQSFGLTSTPPAGAEGLFLSSGGRSDRGHMLGLEHPTYRLKGNPSGTTVLYDASGNAIRAYAASGLQIEAKAGGVWVKPQDGQKVFLGGDGKTGSYAPVMTSSGPSTNVFARYA